MTASPFSGSVAIDTNVFLHLLNPQNNTGLHIDELLRHLQLLGTRIVVDKKGIVFGEYNRLITPVISRQHDSRDEIRVLRYWIRYAPHHKITLDCQDRLMTAIASIITEPSESVDKILVYVALRSGKILITNDSIHIISGPQREQSLPPRRRRLLRSTRKRRPAGAEILTSQEAHARIP